MFEIVPNPQQYIDRMRRVRVDWEFTKLTYEWYTSGAYTEEQQWENLRVYFRRHPRLLVVASTRRAARKIYDLLPSREKYHMSRRMCSAHLSDTLHIISSRLKKKKLTRLVSTNLIEAGVDLDFTAGYRMMCGIDSLVQTAGRINREGKNRRLGTLRPFFCPAPPPPGMLRWGVETTLSMLNETNWKLDIFDVAAQKKFFRLLYESADNDHHEVMRAEENFSFQDVDWRNRWIKNNHMIDVVVPYRDEGHRLVQALLEEKELTYSDSKLLQRYVVSLYPQDYDKLQGTVVPVCKHVQGVPEKSSKKDEDEKDRLYVMPPENARVFYDHQLGVRDPEDIFEDENFVV